ncbi:YegP family protein [Flavobacterium gawalongense]|uniref:DUF1508 domain-containing protein n=1 Tax=Flavobacterium gawalongense TaxID=2594432 RepID=A0A553BL47_9FLAO|nr:DUF1508 domain-containing protein [Flavobacterium gawalongense]TRX00398.1 DUF1508 domain-containing protein [Flavobacterium gawalongense]TRX05055.1 DUF1508 domain-containing protein [Flavobacterium gawalongense]TRX08973.1 DUF1508 domain-containing protein [Flavobacterium gawalongense]TRX10040.1 DUF1508 domain-containing protein [Flavobacterium gawalongense]TRX26927.1 DUF1508 domain-containing protein [Flavobacterium gawalongense]
MDKVRVIIRLPKFEIYQNENTKEWYWRIKVGSDIVASSSEGYKNHSECLKNVTSVEKHIKYLRENDLIK